MAEFAHVDLHGSRFEHVDLAGAELHAVDLSGARFRAVTFNGAVLRGVELVGVDIEGEVVDLRVNGVDVGPLVEAELDRRQPGRALMRPDDPAGFRRAWDLLEELWAGTVARAERLDPALLHESVDGEWSFVQTLRHLVFATDAWVRRALLGDPAPWDPLDLPWDEMAETAGVPHDREARPGLPEVLALRRDRVATVRAYVDGLDETGLEATTEPVPGPGWPPAQAFGVRECLLTVLNEEWEHRRYAERDLAVLEQRAPGEKAEGERAAG